MPHLSTASWDCHNWSCGICTSPHRDELTLLRCAIVTLLEHGRWMAADEIPLSEILTGASDYLVGLAGPRDDDTPVPAANHRAWVDAELRLAVARAAGLDAVSTLDPRIDSVLTAAASRSWRRQMDLLDLAAEQFTQRHPRPARTH
ncbi:hypothetical protein [Streptomyces sp. NPDC005017]|uniref:hypothetical protein n=1 Tax=Streptomyces sp. NPDC005017 TaxID=3364706 RepID=UPI00369FE934